MSLKIQTIYAQACTPRASGSEDPAGIWTNTSLSISLKFKQLPIQTLRLVTFETYSNHYKGYNSKYLIWYEVFIGLWTIGARWLFFPVSWSTSIFYKIKGTQLLYHLLVLLLFISPKMKVVGDCVSGVIFSLSLAWSCQTFPGALHQPVLQNWWFRQRFACTHVVASAHHLIWKHCILLRKRCVKSRDGSGTLSRRVCPLLLYWLLM